MGAGVCGGENDRKGRDGVNPSSTQRRFNTPRISECRGVDEVACPLATLAVVLATAPLAPISSRQWGTVPTIDAKI